MPFDPASLAIQATTSGVQSFFKLLAGIKQNKLAKKINPQQVTYQASPYAQNNLGLAQQLYGGRMAGASQMQNNIYTNQANTMANINRNATSSSQALAMAAGVQGNTNQALNNLQLQEMQSQEQRAGALFNANQGMTAEHDKIYNDNLRKYQEDVAAKAALKNAAMQNIYGGIGDLGQTASTAAGMMGGGGGGSIAGAIGNPGAAMGQGFANVPMQAPNTRMIPLPNQGSSMRFNYLTGRWE